MIPKEWIWMYLDKKKRCIKCDIELQLYKPTSGAYYKCDKCNNITYPL